MIKVIDDEALTFDDVLLVPQFNEIASRQDVSLETRLTREGLPIAAPLISANMDTVTESEMMQALCELGCAGILHRFMDLETTARNIITYRLGLQIKGKGTYPTCVSLGVNGNTGDLIEMYKEMAVDIICIDVAHGHSSQVIQMIKQVKTRIPTCHIIAGNVATGIATEDLIVAGADAIKVGIGPGSLCTTRIVTGNGVPQLTAIMNCYNIAKKHNVPIIADGGIRSSGDIVKALAAGAETVMLGSMFAGTHETPGEKEQVFNHDGDNTNKFYKVYRGMASKDAMTGWKGADYHAAPEGEATLIPYKGSVSEIVEPILAGIRSGMTYQGSRNLAELRQKSRFRRISPNCLSENIAHGK